MSQFISMLHYLLRGLALASANACICQLNARLVITQLTIFWSIFDCLPSFSCAYKLQKREWVDRYQWNPNHCLQSYLAKVPLFYFPFNPAFCWYHFKALRFVIWDQDHRCQYTLLIRRLCLCCWSCSIFLFHSFMLLFN